MTLPLPLIKAEGNPAECGASYGAAAADLIAANTAAYLERFASRAGIDPVAARRAGAAFRVQTVQAQPRIAAMLDGVAEGAGVAVEEIYALNGRTELLYGAAQTDARRLADPAKVPAHECTAIGALDSRTASGHTLLAQNWDWHPAQRPFTLLLATCDERGLSAVTLAEAGMLAKAGVNSAGLGVCVNMLGCDRDGRPGGVPYHVLLRAALEAQTLGRAIKAVCGVPRSASINLLLGQAYGECAPGELIDLELAPGDVGLVHPDEGVLTHANHFESGIGVHDTLKDLGGSSFYRSARARRLLGAAPLEEKDLAAVLSDHGGYPHAICRHDLDAATEDERSESLYSVVLDLDERRMAIAPGPPCEAGSYIDVRLSELFPGTW